MKAKTKTAVDIYGPEPKAVAAALNRLHIRYVDVTKIMPLEQNFKRHALVETRKSILKRGVIDPIGINAETGKNFDGHGRVEALQAMRQDWLDAGKPTDAESPFRVPGGVIPQGDTWYVPTVDGVRMTEQEAVAAAAALNRINELGGYDEAMMAEVLANLAETDGLEATGYTDEDVAAVIKRFERDNQMDDIEIHDGDGEDATFGGLKTSAPISNTRQIALIFQPDVHQEFIEHVTKLSARFKTDNVTDTVLAVVRHVAKEDKQ